MKKARLVSTWIFAGAIAVLAVIFFARLIAEDNHVLMIARQFKCICKMNCGLDAGHCPCKEPGGASEMKAAIHKALKKGLNDDQIRALLLSGGAVSQ